MSLKRWGWHPPPSYRHDIMEVNEENTVTAVKTDAEVPTKEELEKTKEIKAKTYF